MSNTIIVQPCREVHQWPAMPPQRKGVEVCTPEIAQFWTVYEGTPSMAVCDCPNEETAKRVATALGAPVNVAAIALEFARDARFETFREQWAEHLSGMSGVYEYVAEIGEAFTAAEWLFDPLYEEVDWYQAMDAFTDGVYALALAEDGTLPNTRELIALAEKCRRENLQ